MTSGFGVLFTVRAVLNRHNDIVLTQSVEFFEVSPVRRESIVNGVY